MSPPRLLAAARLGAVSFRANLARLIRDTEARTADRRAGAGLASPWADGQLQSVVWADLLDTELLPITRAEAMAVPAIARARHILCGTIGRLPLRAYRADDLATPLPQQPAWLTRTDLPVSAFHRNAWTVDDLIFTGWSLWQIARDGENQVGAAERVDRAAWSFGSDGAVMLGDKPISRDVMAARYLLIPGPHEGILNYAQTTIRASTHLLHASARASENPVPMVELHDTGEKPRSDPEIAGAIAQWRKARRESGVGYTSRNLDLKTHGAQPEHLLIEGRNAAAVDAARVVGVPAATIDATTAGASLTYETIAGRNQELAETGLAMYLAAVSARLSLNDVAPAGTVIRFDLEEWLAGVPSATGENPTTDREDPAP